MIYQQFVKVNTGSPIKITDAGGFKVTQAVPEKHNFKKFLSLNM